MLARWTSDREVRVQALAGALCCVLGQDTLLSQCLPPPRSINGYQRNAGGVTCDGLASHPGGIAIFLVACYRNRDKLRLSWATRLVRLNMAVRKYKICLRVLKNIFTSECSEQVKYLSTREILYLQAAM